MKILPNMLFPSTIAIFNPRDRALSKREIGIFFNTLKNAQTSHALKVALKLLMLTMVRKSNLVNATWDEIDFVANTYRKMKVSRQARSRQTAYRLFLTVGSRLIYAITCTG